MPQPEILLIALRGERAQCPDVDAHPQLGLQAFNRPGPAYAIVRPLECADPDTIHPAIFDILPCKSVGYAQVSKARRGHHDMGGPFVEEAF